MFTEVARRLGRLNHGYEGLALGDLLRRLAQLDPDRPWLSRLGGPLLTLGEVDELTDRIACGLEGHGVGYGDRVLVFSENRLEIIFTWLASNKLGAVFTPVNAALRGKLLDHVIATTSPTVVCSSPSLTAVIQAPINASTTSVAHVVFDPAEKTPDARETATLQFAELQRSGASPTPPVDARDMQSIIFTSGTTGPSKGVMVSHLHALHFAEAIASAAKMDENDVWYTCLPLFHVNAHISVLTSLLSGGRIVVHDRFSASKLLDDLTASGATMFSLFGAMLPIFLHGLEEREIPEHRLRVCWSFPAPPEACATLERRLGLRVLTGYASTEANFVSVTSLDGPRRPNSTGPIRETHEVLIADENGQAMPAGQVGEILVRPRVPFAMNSGYFGMPDATVKAWQNLWFHSGDAGFIDDDGDLHFVDRLSDSIRRRGENISSMEVEQGLLDHPAVVECAVIGVPSELGEQEVLAVVVLDEDAQISPAEIVDWAIGRMAKFMVPRFIQVRTELPKTPNGKVLKRKLRREGTSGDTWDMEQCSHGRVGDD